MGIGDRLRRCAKSSQLPSMSLMRLRHLGSTHLALDSGLGRAWDAASAGWPRELLHPDDGESRDD